MPAGAPLGPGAEFDLIRALVADARGHPQVLLGAGDDAAVLDGGWVVSSDLSVEDVHFRRAWLDPGEIGARAVSVALSDLAAMAAEPVAVLVSLAGTPADHADGTLEAVGRGARAAAEAVGASLVGGDLTRSPGPLLVDVTVLGRAVAPVLRSGGRPGDELWVTGPLGGASTAIRLLDEGVAVPPPLRERLASPRPRLAAARALAATGLVHALIDLSDGLAGDAAHLAAACGARVVLDDADLPAHPEAVTALGAGPAREQVLHGGEDYELLMAAAPGLGARAGELSDALGIQLVRVGRLEPGEGVWLRGADGALRPAGGGWDHFREPGAPSSGSPP
jgi:thiamine-monophosphate kinase